MPGERAKKRHYALHDILEAVGFIGRGLPYLVIAAGIGILVVITVLAVEPQLRFFLLLVYIMAILPLMYIAWHVMRRGTSILQRVVGLRREKRRTDRIVERYKTGEFKSVQGDTGHIGEDSRDN